MDKFSRREFIYISASLPLVFPSRSFAINVEKNYPIISYPDTIWVLKQAFKSEMIAHKHYVKFAKKALAEKYPNIDYLFHAFSFSEKIHADNYKRIISKFGSNIKNNLVSIDVGDTKSSLLKAAQEELKKIEKTYPEFLKKLETELCEEAIINCMYSWKSHCQHEEIVRTIQRYSGLFFGSVAREIEGVNFDFHVCEICGSTIDEEPNSPCQICNRSMSHYKKVGRPA
ncbi:MAG: hypothetical protein SRB2_01756 [Desulfobacteraceae bacterium Eth-SRB2]|nr:MAG: hypothetical protein SRB2_01756 [Desulfobacteraceae bacterium Eth-SRB2]